MNQVLFVILDQAIAYYYVNSSGCHTTKCNTLANPVII